MAEVQAELQTESGDTGKFARHPMRTMASAFAIGTAVGVGMSKARHHTKKSSLQKFIDQLGK